jgi:hypothetical protein
LTPKDGIIKKPRGYGAFGLKHCLVWAGTIKMFSYLYEIGVGIPNVFNIISLSNITE